MSIDPLSFFKKIMKHIPPRQRKSKKNPGPFGPESSMVMVLARSRLAIPLPAGMEFLVVGMVH